MSNFKYIISIPFLRFFICDIFLRYMHSEVTDSSLISCFFFCWSVFFSFWQRIYLILLGKSYWIACVTRGPNNIRFVDLVIDLPICTYCASTVLYNTLLFMRFWVLCELANNKWREAKWRKYHFNEEFTLDFHVLTK